MDIAGGTLPYNVFNACANPGSLAGFTAIDILVR